MVLTVVAAIDAYNYDLQNDIDIMEGFGSAICFMIGGFFIFFECDLFYTVYYFLFKPKTISKTLLNILSTGSLSLIITYTYLIEAFMELRKYESPILVVMLGLSYIFLRIAYLIVCGCQADKIEVS